MCPLYRSYYRGFPFIIYDFLNQFIRTALFIVSVLSAIGAFKLMVIKYKINKFDSV